MRPAKVAGASAKPVDASGSAKGNPGDRPAPRAGSVPLGYVSRPNGLGGAVVVHTDPSMNSTLVRGLDVELVPRKGSPILTTVRSAAPVRGGLRVTLDRITTRDQSEALVGATVHVERERLGPLKDGEFLDTDLVGLSVVTTDGQLLGRLEEVIATGANDVYVVRSPEGAEIMVPAVAHAVLDVDLAASRMTVNGEALEYSPPSAPKTDPGKS